MSQTRFRQLCSECLPAICMSGFGSVCQCRGLLKTRTKSRRSCSWRPSSLISVFRCSEDAGTFKASCTSGDTSDNLKDNVARFRVQQSQTQRKDRKIHHIQLNSSTGGSFSYCLIVCKASAMSPVSPLPLPDLYTCVEVHRCLNLQFTPGSNVAEGASIIQPA